MDASRNLAVEERFAALLSQLGIERVHIAGGFAPNAVALAKTSPNTVASATLICPMQMPPEPFMPPGAPLLVVYGSGAVMLPGLVSGLPDATSLQLSDYEGAPWSNVLAERGDEIAPTMLEFLSRAEQLRPIEPARLVDGDGEIAGITYRIRGSGPPVLLLPLNLARSQWEPLVPVLAQHHTTIVVGGAHMGVVPLLEGRMQGRYRGVLRAVVDRAHPRNEDAVLEVGCGPGAVARWRSGLLVA